MNDFKRPIPPQMPQVKVDVGDLPDIRCECNNDTFIQGTRIKKMSALISPDGKDRYIFNEVKICAQCFTALPGKP